MNTWRRRAVLKWVALVLIGLVLLLALRYRSLVFRHYPWYFGWGLLALGCIFILAAIFYSRRLVKASAVLLPVALLAGFILNIRCYSAGQVWHLPLSFTSSLADFLDLSCSSKGDHWSLTRLQSNSYIDLMGNGRFYYSTAYAFIFEHFAGKTLVAPPGLIEELGLDPWSLVAWGRLAKVETRPYQAELTGPQVEELLRHKTEQVNVVKRDTTSTVTFIMDSPDPSGTLCLARSGEQVFVLPVELLPAQNWD
jgi:hypothetical protein